MKKISLLIILSFLSCDITENRWLIINNKSKTTISTFVTDRELKDGNLNSKMDIAIEVAKNDDGRFQTGFMTWEEYIEKCDDKKIRLYLISKDSISKYGWKNIYKKRIYNKMYLLTIEDLEKRNWEFTYE